MKEFTIEDIKFLNSLEIDFDELEAFNDNGVLWLKLKKDGEEVYRNYQGEGNIPSGLFQGLKKDKTYTHDELEEIFAKNYPFVWLCAMAQKNEGKVMKEAEQELKAENELLRRILEDISGKAMTLLDFIEAKGLVGECKEFIREREGECSHKS